MTFLRLFAITALFVGMFTNEAAAQANSATQPALSIAIKPVSSTFVLGKQALVKITITNVSKKTVTLDVTAPHPAYHLFDFSLTANNQVIKETPLHRSIKNRQRVDDPPVDLSLKSILVDIPPGTTRAYEADLAHLFSIEEASTYRLVVSMIDPTNGSQIISPELLIAMSK